MTGAGGGGGGATLASSIGGAIACCTGIIIMPPQEAKSAAVGSSTTSLKCPRCKQSCVEKCSRMLNPPSRTVWAGHAAANATAPLRLFDLNPMLIGHDGAPCRGTSSVAGVTASGVSSPKIIRYKQLHRGRGPMALRGQMNLTTRGAHAPRCRPARQSFVPCRERIPGACDPIMRMR